MLTKIILDVKIKTMKKKFCSFFISISLALLLFFFFGCSLEYESDSPEQIKAPEFSFENLELTKIEKGKKTAVIQASKLDQYHKIDASYAQNIKFTLFNNNLIKIEGEADLLSLDNKSEVYTMFNSVSITSYEQNMQIQAKNLKWNNKTEQLTSSAEDIVTITNIPTPTESGYVKPKSENTNQISLQGKGFSASGVTWQYAFKNATTGKIIINDKGTTDELTEE